MADLVKEELQDVDWSSYASARVTRSSLALKVKLEASTAVADSASQAIKPKKEIKEETKIKHEAAAIKAESTSNPKAKPVAKKRRVKVKVEYDTTPPLLWQQQLDNIRKMRENKDAPVDALGCEVLADLSAPEHIQKFHVLVALMLSAQTRDECTAVATRKLQALDGGLTPANMVALPEATVAENIRVVGFWRRKAQFIQRTSRILLDEYGGHIPPTLEGLLALPGVGMKMAQIVMAVAHKEITGLGIDTHCHRIMNRLGWCKTENAEQTRLAVEAWMPREQWEEINILFVGFGQQICNPRFPKCKSCINSDICPASSLKEKENDDDGEEPTKKKKKKTVSKAKKTSSGQSSESSKVKKETKAEPEQHEAKLASPDTQQA